MTNGPQPSQSGDSSVGTVRWPDPSLAPEVEVDVQRDDIYRAGAEAERLAVVAWLRRWADSAQTPDERFWFRVAATDIEKGMPHG